jgi:hypothetical protein
MKNLQSLLQFHTANGFFRHCCLDAPDPPGVDYELGFFGLRLGCEPGT